MEVKIYYDGGLNTELDSLFEKTLKPLGLRRWASGMNMVTQERDLAFTDTPSPKTAPGCPV